MSEQEATPEPEAGLPKPREAFRQFLRNAFVLPFQDPMRSFMYFISFFFALGFAFLDVFITIDAAGLGAPELTAYMLAKFGGITVLMPAALLCMGRVGDKVFYAVLVAMMLAGLFYVVLRGGAVAPLEAGFFYALFVSPFWAVYHIMFAVATSDENMGNEISLSGTGMTVGITFGSLAGGVCSQLGLEAAGMIVGFLIVGAATTGLIVRAISSNLIDRLRQTGAIDETMWAALKRCKYRSLGSLLEGIFNIVGGNLWILYLRLAGISAAAVGAWQALMVVSKIIITPFAGALVNHGRRREMVLGAGLNLLGWTPFLFGAHSFFVMISMNVWAVGTHLFSTGLTSAWYGSRTIAAIVVREIILGVGRIATVLLLTPVIYASTEAFIDITIIVGAAMVVYAALWMRSLKMKGPVLPIENIVTKV